MFRVKLHQRVRISHHLAALAALLLMASSAATVFDQSEDSDGMMASQESGATHSAQAGEQSIKAINQAVRSAGGFKMRLFGFPRS
jgi:hypothetical protein